MSFDLSGPEWITLQREVRDSDRHQSVLHEMSETNPLHARGLSQGGFGGGSGGGGGGGGGSGGEATGGTVKDDERSKDGSGSRRKSASSGRKSITQRGNRRRRNSVLRDGDFSGNPVVLAKKRAPSEGSGT